MPAAAQHSIEIERVRLESANQLPQHRYPIRESAAKLLVDDAQFGIFAETLEADLRSDLAQYEITDESTLKDYYSTLGSLALIEGDYASAIIYADRVRAIEDKPALRLLAGTLERALAEAAAVPPSYQELAFEDAYRKVIAGLPFEQVQAELRTLKATTEIMSPNVTLWLVQDQVEPTAKSGEISRELANLIVQARLTIEVLEPFRDEMITVLGEMIADHTIQWPDIQEGPCDHHHMSYKEAPRSPVALLRIAAGLASSGCERDGPASPLSRVHQQLTSLAPAIVPSLMGEWPRFEAKGPSRDGEWIIS